MITCSKCGEVKPPHEFYPKRNVCKSCFHPKAKGHKPSANPKYQAYWVKSQYGLDYETYLDMRSKGCEICGRLDGKLCVDHDHHTGKVRGILCTYCNQLVGQLEKFPGRLHKAEQYLRNKNDVH